MPGLSRFEVEAFFYAVHQGWLTLRCTDAKIIYAGDVHYETPDGWRLTVFNDCDSWDYMDCLTSPDGRSMDFDEAAAIGFYPSPPNQETAKRCYGIA